ncbi:hypothetical protein MRB53_038090 [Persea americana]|nr:hypothetical protein MRB53_038090 [Persea americana]
MRREFDPRRRSSLPGRLLVELHQVHAARTAKPPPTMMLRTEQSFAPQKPKEYREVAMARRAELRAKSASEGRAECAQESADDRSSGSRAEVETKFRAQDTKRHDTNVH